MDWLAWILTHPWYEVALAFIFMNIAGLCVLISLGTGHRRMRNRGYVLTALDQGLCTEKQLVARVRHTMEDDYNFSGEQEIRDTLEELLQSRRVKAVRPSSAGEGSETQYVTARRFYMQQRVAMLEARNPTRPA